MLRNGLEEEMPIVAAWQGRPEVQEPNLTSRILSLNLRRLSRDWQMRAFPLRI
jgi:hypothetical protein